MFTLKRYSYVAFILICIFSLFGCGKSEEKTTAVSTAKTTAGAVQEKVKEVPQAPSTAPITEERVFFGFETADLNGWEVPLWAQGKSDYVAGEYKLSKDQATEGESSMMVLADFPGGLWYAALVEIEQYLDLSSYRVLSADLFVPADAPMGLKAKIILTIGETWKFVEMSRSVPLLPGEWVTITANLEPGSYDWKRVVPDEKFAEDVRKVAIRIESNRRPKYSGPIYIDNIRVGR